MWLFVEREGIATMTSMLKSDAFRANSRFQADPQNEFGSYGYGSPKTKASHAVRADHRSADLAQPVRESGNEGILGADDHEIDRLLLGERDDALANLAEMVDGAFGEDGAQLGQEMRANGGIAL